MIKMNTRGFSLIEVMAALVGSSILILVLGSSMVMLNNSKRNLEMSQDATEFISEMRETLKTSANCSTVLTGKTFDTANATGTSIANAQISVRGKNYGVGSEVSPGLTIRDIKVSNVTPNAKASPISMGNNTYYQRVVNMVIEMDKPQGIGPAPAPFYIPMPVITSAQNGSVSIVKCMDAESAQQSICTDLNFYWDTSTVPSKCLPTNKCLYAGSFSPAPTGGFVNPITNQNKCPDGYYQQVTGSVSASVSCGKKCVNNAAYPVYECVRCLDAQGRETGNMSHAMMGDITSSINLDPDIEEAEEDYLNQQNALASGVLEAHLDPNYTCLPSGTVITDETPGANCPNAPVIKPNNTCCSGSSSDCMVSVSADWLSGFSYEYASKSICN